MAPPPSGKDPYDYKNNERECLAGSRSTQDSVSAKGVIVMEAT
jgi:hypothetical protein